MNSVVAAPVKKSSNPFRNFVITVGLIVVGIPLGIFLSEHRNIFFSKASSTSVPSEVKISNLTDNSFTVSWKTQDKLTGYVAYGTGENLSSAQSDDRDDKSRMERNIHYVTIKNLNPATDYSFKIGSGTETFDNNGKPYTVKTGPLIQGQAVNNNPISGTLERKDQTIPEEGIIYLTVDKDTLLSILIRNDGTWTLDLNNLRAKDLQSYKYIGSDTVLELSAEGGSDGTIPSKVMDNSQNTGNDLVLNSTRPVATDNQALSAVRKYIKF